MTLSSKISQFLDDEKRMYTNKIGNILETMPSFINIVKANVPQEVFTAILSDEQKEQLINGTVEFMHAKDGGYWANLVDSKTKKIVANISFKNIEITPELNNALTDYSMQSQMFQLAEKLEFLQAVVEDVRLGLENDRLATALSCQQKFLQISNMRDDDNRNNALLRLVMDAEDSRNLLMLSQQSNVDFIKQQPHTFWQKITSGATPKEITSRINEIRESMYVINAVSLVEAIAYQEMGEIDSSRQSLEYYHQYIQSTFTDDVEFLERLDRLDDQLEKYWSIELPAIEEHIQSCIHNESLKLLR